MKKRMIALGLIGIAGLGAFASSKVFADSNKVASPEEPKIVECFGEDGTNQYEPEIVECFGEDDIK